MSSLEGDPEAFALAIVQQYLHEHGHSQGVPRTRVNRRSAEAWPCIQCWCLVLVPSMLKDGVRAVSRCTKR